MIVTTHTAHHAPIRQLPEIVGALKHTTKVNYSRPLRRQFHPFVLKKKQPALSLSAQKFRYLTLLDFGSCLHIAMTCIFPGLIIHTPCSVQSGKRLSYKKNKTPASGSGSSTKNSSGSSRNHSLTPSLDTMDSKRPSSKVLTEKRPSITGLLQHKFKIIISKLCILERYLLVYSKIK